MTNIFLRLVVDFLRNLRIIWTVRNILMNKRDFLEKLKEALIAFVIHDELIIELLTLLQGSGNEKAFLAILVKRLRFLIDLGIQATIHEEFEPISEGIYSFHLSGKRYNIRILYGFLSNRRPALLMAFYERAGHKATDYTGKVHIALERLAEMEAEC